MNKRGMGTLRNEKEIYKLINRVKDNKSFLTEDDIKALEWMATKGYFPNEKIQVVNKNSVPFVDEVEEFNILMGKSYQNRTTPTIDLKDAQFVIDFIQEELDELKMSVEQGNLVEILDALLDITYVGLGNGALVFGMKDLMLKGYAEVQASNLSKICKTEAEAMVTVNIVYIKKGVDCYYKPIGDGWVVYRTSDNKVMKSINYFPPNLKQFFTEDELKNSYAYLNK